MPYRPSMLYRTILLLILSGLVLFAGAVPAIAAGDEETVALNFLKFLGRDKTILSAEILQNNALAPALPPVAVGHLFHLTGGGYLLVSPNRTISPVKAYSLSSDFVALPPAYRQALLAELELRVRVAMASTATRSPLAAEPTETGRQWDFLLTYDGAGRQPLAYTIGEYLVKTRWNQGYPYNKFLPVVDGKTVAAGCVNVALAQVMRYYGAPDSSKGVVYYTWTPPSPQSPELLKTILYRSYNWPNMPETIDASTPEYLTDEVAMLIRDLGIANRTKFDAGGSSTSLDTRMVMENFGYSTGLSEMDNTNYGAFLATLNGDEGEFKAERPVLLTFPDHTVEVDGHLLTFPGHMVVADGYRTETIPVGDSIHINMGWGGTADHFYFLNAPVQYDNNDPNRSFPTDAGRLRIYYKIKPCSEGDGDCAVNLEQGDGIDGLAIAGAFNREKDTDLYPVYLKGQTTLSVTRNWNWSNIGYYTHIVNPVDGSIVYQVPDPGTARSGGAVFSAGNLPAGKYGVRVSLCNETGTSCYSNEPDSPYTVTLTSDVLTVEEKSTVDQALDKPPVIGNFSPDLILNADSLTSRILIDARDENGDAVQLQVTNANPGAVGASLNGKILSLTPTGAAKVASRITVVATANGKTEEKSFTVMTDDSATAFGRSFTVGGTFAGQNDLQSHRVILDGACTITGSRPSISNQAFFSSVLNASNEEVGSADGDPTDGHSLISGSFLQGIHQLRAVLCSNEGCYSFSTGDTYNFTVNCPDADTRTATIAGLLGINLSGSVSWGDVNGDYEVNLADAILALRVLSHTDTSGKTILIGADLNEDVRIGLAEAIFILQRTAGLRN